MKNPQNRFDSFYSVAMMVFGVLFTIIFAISLLMVALTFFTTISATLNAIFAKNAAGWQFLLHSFFAIITHILCLFFSINFIISGNTIKNTSQHQVKLKRVTIKNLIGAIIITLYTVLSHTFGLAVLGLLSAIFSIIFMHYHTATKK